MGFDLSGLLGGFNPSALTGGVVEDMLHDNAADLAAAVCKGLLSIPHEANELPCITLAIANGEVVAIVGTTYLDGTPARDITMFSLASLMRTVPVGAWMKASKEMEKEQERITKAQAKLAATDTAGREALLQRIDALAERARTAYAWPGVTDQPAFQHTGSVTSLGAHEVKQLPPDTTSTQTDNEQRTTDNDAQRTD